jgi:hypothetical protein
MNIKYHIKLYKVRGSYNCENSGVVAMGCNALKARRYTNVYIFSLEDGDSIFLRNAGTYKFIRYI